MFSNPLSHSYGLNAILYATLLFSLVYQAQGLAISYCSPENNAGSYPSYWNEFQSNGECQTHCQGSYAFAVLQGNYCWCSNYIPEDQVSTYDCNQQCPGYPDEWCGSTDAGLYGYYLLSPGVPLGTSAGSSGSIASSTSSLSSSVSTSLTKSGSPSHTTVVRTSPSTSSPPVITVGRSQGSDEDSYTTYSTATSTTSPSSMSRSSSSSTTSDLSTITSSPPTANPSQTEVYTSVTTVTGEVRTVIVTPSPTATADATLGQSSTGGGGGVNTGKVVGIVLGTVLGISAIVGAGLWLWFRRRRQNRENGAPESAFIARPGDRSPSNIVPSRQVSQLSSSGLLGTKAPRLNTSGPPSSSDPRSADTASSGFDRRSVGTDQRLNPYALYIHDESRLSDVSLQDNQDYSRQLRVANPDP